MNKFSFKILAEVHSEEIFLLQNNNLDDFGKNIWKTDELKKSIKENVFEGHVFIYKEKINGFCFFKKIDDFIEIHSLFVVQECRKKGVAKNLLECCVKYCEKNNLRRIILDVNENNLHAIKFYKKHDFFLSGRRKDYYRNKESFNDSFTMCKLV